MKPKSSAQKSNPRASFIENKWRSVLDLFEANKGRRGKAMEKQGLVVDFSMTEHDIKVKIQGPKMRFGTQDYRVTLPAFGNGKAYQSKVAHLLYERPDWLGALLLGEWDPLFWQELSELGLKWYPDEDSAGDFVRSITCSCSDPDMPCFHAAAALFTVLREMEDHPLFALRFLGIEDKILLDEAHRLGCTQTDFLESNGAVETSGLEEEAVYHQNSGENEYSGERIRHRLPPNWNDEKRLAWRERYMALE